MASESSTVPLSAEEYARGVKAGDATVLARAITVVESTAPQHAGEAAELMKLLLPHRDHSVRIGITGVP
ncbi:MAG: hypothetical protein JHD33_09185, partial [Chthoniobacterales bacterium]|nr:hypothetical protein [Chthoniobacterales bacterium]